MGLRTKHDGFVRRAGCLLLTAGVIWHAGAGLHGSQCLALFFPPFTGDIWGGEQESATVELLILQTPANTFAPLLEPAVRH